MLTANYAIMYVSVQNTGFFPVNFYFSFLTMKFMKEMGRLSFAINIAAWIKLSPSNKYLLISYETVEGTAQIYMPRIITLSQSRDTDCIVLLYLHEGDIKVMHQQFL